MLYRRYLIGMSIVILLFMSVLSLFSSQTAPAFAQGGRPGAPDVVHMIGPVSLNSDLRDLPVIPARQRLLTSPLLRHPAQLGNAAAEMVASKASTVLPQYTPSPLMPAPLQTFPGITSGESGCGCLPPDTEGDVGQNHYIQSVNSSFKIIDKSGGQLLAPTTYNSFFSALGTGNACGNNQNDGDAVVFYDHMADRWVISDFAFAAFTGTAFYQCIGVSKTGDPVAGGWWLYALQIDPSNPSYLGDYPKFGLWNDAYYMTVNLFSNNTTFNGVRVFALNRSAMLNGNGTPTPSAVAFTISSTTLGNAYSLLPATFRHGAPPAGTDEYLLAVDSTDNSVVNNSVYAWRFHVDWTTPANSTLGTGATHAPNATITVASFYNALENTGTKAMTLEVPQSSTTRRLDTLGDKLMFPLVYQNLNGVESLYASQTVNTASNASGFTNATGIRWYQFIVTGGVIPAAPAQQQTFSNASDGLWRWMPSLNVDAQGNLAIGYTTSSTAIFPGIRYAGRLAGDSASTLAQGEAVLQAGGGNQTSTSGRWGDYSATFVDPLDGCTFYHTNEYYSASSSAAWNTQIGSFKFPACQSTAPITGLTASNNSPKAPGSTVAFTATINTGSNVSYTWNFGDGSVTAASSITMASHVYVSAANYTALVTATNSISTVVATTPVTITEVPISSLSAANSSPTRLGQSTAFTASLAAGSNVSFQWNYGDGGVSSSSALSTTAHTYAAIGAYTAHVTATNSVSTVVATTPVTITDVPITGLSAANSSPTRLGHSTAFTASLTAGSNVSYQWNYGDGGVSSSSALSTTAHTYAAIGVYTATVTATNSVSMVVAATLVTINDALITGLVATNNSPTLLGQITTLTASITSGTHVAFDWNFGDGQTGSGVIVMHTYALTGTYTASVTATNSTSGPVVATMQVIVTDVLDVPISGLAASNDSPKFVDATISFTATIITGTNVVYQWNYGDGQTGGGEVSTHAYSAVGIYTALLTATNGTSGPLVAATLVTITDRPIAGLNAANNSPTLVNHSTALTATISAGSNVSYTWNFGDGTASGDGLTVLHTYTTWGNFTATVTATNSLSTLIKTTVIEIVPYRIVLPLVLMNF